MSPRALAYFLLALSPIFFSSNLILGSIAVKTVEPFTLTMFRWGLAFLLILPLAYGAMRNHVTLFMEQWKLILVNAFLAMGVCGAGVYWALKYTSATNGTLIYTSSPVLILIMEWLFRGRSISSREIIGIILAVFGVLFIVFKGSWQEFMAVQFNTGDILFVMAATGWAIYSVLSKKRVFQPVPTIGMFAIVALIGALIQVPFAIYETVVIAPLPASQNQWIILFALAFVSSVLAFITYQYGIKILGPAPAGIFMYLLPPVGVVQAVVFLGEQFLPFHMVGLVLVMAGVITATLPMGKLFKSGKMV